MERDLQDLNKLFARIEAKEKRFRFQWAIYILLMIVIGLNLIYWNTKKSLKINSQTKVVFSLQDSVKIRNAALDSLKNKLNKIMQAREQIDIGIAYAKRGKFSEAIDAYNTAIMLDPSNPNAYHLLGYVYLRQGNNSKTKALENLKFAAELSPNSVWIRYNLALAYWENGDRSSAISEVKKVLELNPQFREIILNDVQFKKFRVSSEYMAIIRGN